MTKATRGRNKVYSRSELADSAAAYCAERGFDAVTVDQLASAVGVSRATFFRYFPTKEEAIVESIRVGRLSLADLLRANVPPPGTRVVDAVRGLLAPTVEAARTAPGLLRDRLQMIENSRALRAHLAFERSEQRAALEKVLLELVEDPTAARAAAHASMAAIDLAWNLWRYDTGADLGRVLDRAFSLIVGIDAVLVANPPIASATNTTRVLP